MGNDDVRSGFLSRGIDTFTLGRLDAILKNERISYNYESDAQFLNRFKRPPPEIRTEISPSWPDGEHVDGAIQSFDNRYAKLRAEEFCQELLRDSTPLSISVTQLDAAFSRFFRFRFEPLDESQAITERASDLLERMPTWPLQLDDVPKEIPPEYRALSIVETASRDASLWEQLQTTTYVSNIVLRVALSVVMSPGSSQGILNVTNITAALLEIFSRLSSTKSDDGTSWKLFVMRAFIWTSWQRCQMLYFYLEATSDLVYGSSDGKTTPPALRGTLPSPNVTIHEMSRRQASLEKPAYMCGWNFELLRTSFVCVGADFRRFHQRYKNVFGNYTGRCVAGQLKSCKGDSPKSCRRFQGMAIEDQSAHDQSCSRNCKQLIWDETSYRSVLGARAVSLAQTESHGSETWQYCNASDRTLAISHVWSHGQGGRPETGFNTCLHLRYARIATSLGCDSYWIDTTCIPNDHQLRAESISKINEIFMNAKVMLVCDKDIMDIDISNMTTKVCETLLVTAIVCDWNVRAWTFFEAFRARRTVHLLCRNNAVVPLKQVIEVIHREGSLDIAILLLAMPHFLPPFDDQELARQDSEGRKNFKPGYLPIETSGSLLSHRAASREGDDFVIWSLLMSEKTIFYDAEAFWKSMQGLDFQTSAKTGNIWSSAAVIQIGYLVSSAPRLKTKGLGWAPASPALYFSTDSEQCGLEKFDGGLGEVGSITIDGLVADWWLYKIDGTGFWSKTSSVAARLRKQSPESQCHRNLARIRAKYLRGYRWGAILWPLDLQRQSRWWDDRSGWDDGSGLRRTILVVCGTNETKGSVVEKYHRTMWGWDENKEAVGWEWRGVYMWDDAEPLPRFRQAQKLLIV